MPALVLFLAIATLSNAAEVATTAPDLTQNSSKNAPKIRILDPEDSSIFTYQPGIKIDWPGRQVIVDARVTLREGLIELFACAPKMREHESIVRIETRPVYLWQAMGLIGISPGHPVLYDEETGREIPADGDPVEIDVRYTSAGRVQTVPIENWMERSDGQAIGRLPWVFAGSIELEDDSIAADYEGTVVAVVDFGSALVALPELHSDRNEELWLRPATAAIPPIGIPCTLIFRPGPVEISLDTAGRLRVGGHRMTLNQAARTIRELAGREDGPRLRVVIDPTCAESEVRALSQLLDSLASALEVVDQSSRPVDEPGPHNADALVGWLTVQLLPILDPGALSETQPAPP